MYHEARPCGYCPKTFFAAAPHGKGNRNRVAGWHYLPVLKHPFHDRVSVPVTYSNSFPDCSPGAAHYQCEETGPVPFSRQADVKPGLVYESGFQTVTSFEGRKKGICRPLVDSRFVISFRTIPRQGIGEIAFR